ncbi:HDOD domain-containing protein [Bermanella marisrubri]|uniref:Diguanylate phosphodiesterase (EAL domain) n=1 Tax=Bermanella marisrubri TaxID=207949 RepID=Q1N4T1_9GAMM|nr:HDOD domain-containing protein [Bermanella marisrubri]EAT13347.1 diguanylate phosphodiesterase (EAL domain) [Oceanobacter sp. RED65] [Bermanella marisrubri]QIZ84103.1 HDOD domain-containing protein [Bermanella marisrubri]
MAENVLLARQPIYNQALEVSAYELLFRQPKALDHAEFECGDKATSHVLLNAFGEAGLDTICGDHPAYINFTRNLIMDLPPFDPKHYVIEILEDIEVDNKLIDALKHAKSMGAKLALDDFILNNNSAPLLHLVDIVKIDVLALSQKQIQRFAEIFVPRGLVLLAEKVETYEMYQFCRNLGFQLFQGYFLSRPQLVEGKTLSDNKLVVMRMLAELQDPEIDVTQLTKTISQDPQMSYKLLRLVNSAAFASVAACTSIQQAITRIGMTHMKRWASLVALGTLDDKPHALIQSCLERAVFCEKIGQRIGQFSPSDFYTIGLFSLLDAFLDRPILEVLKSLRIPQEMEKAILNKNGPLGLALNTCIRIQEGRLNDINSLELEQYGLNVDELSEIYKVALIEADSQSKELE